MRRRDTQTALYRLYGDRGLLYVGIAFNPEARFYGHATDKIWWHEVTSREIEWFPTRDAALGAETLAVERERPLYNISKQASGVTPEAPLLSPAVAARQQWLIDVRDDAEAEVLDAVAEFKAAPGLALARRNERLRSAAALGLSQTEIIKLTGYSRETVRQALNPDARAAVKHAAEERRAHKAERPTADDRAQADGSSAN